MIKTSDLRDIISTNRTFIMGCAMICIMLFHQPFFWKGALVPLWVGFHSIGHWGVDVFLFVSGFGIVHSLRKNSLKVYFANRVKRLVPACVVFGAIIGFLYICFGINYYYTDSLFVILSSLWLWYIYAIIIYYLLAPMVLRLINKSGG